MKDILSTRFGLSVLLLLIVNLSPVTSRAIRHKADNETEEWNPFCRPCDGSLSYDGILTTPEYQGNTFIPDIEQLAKTLTDARKKVNSLKNKFYKKMSKGAKKESKIESRQRQQTLTKEQRQIESQSLKHALQHSVQRLTKFAPYVKSLRNNHERHHEGINTKKMEKDLHKLVHDSHIGVSNILCTLHQMAQRFNTVLPCPHVDFVPETLENRVAHNSRAYIVLDHMAAVYNHIRQVFVKVKKNLLKPKKQRRKNKRRRAKGRHQTGRKQRNKKKQRNKSEGSS